MSDTVSASDWIKGIALSILASVIGASSKLAIRKSWLMQHEHAHNVQVPTEENDIYAYTDDFHPSASYQALTTQNSTDEYDTTTRPDAIDNGEVHDALSEELLDVSDDQPTRTISPSRSSSSPTVNFIAWTLRGCGMIGMTFLNPACCVWAMKYASPSILAPFSGLTLVWIIFFSQPLIGEKPTVRQIVAASLIITGEVLVAVFGDHLNAPEMTIPKVTQSYKQAPFLIYMAGTMSWVLILMYWIRYAHNPTLKRFAWGVAGGSMTGLQNFLKDLLTLLQVRRPHERLPWYTPLFAVLAGLTAFWGLCFLTWCMKRYDATYSAAMFVGSFVVNASIMSAVHYQTFQHLEGMVNFIMYPAGLLTLMGGVCLLVKEKGAAVLHGGVEEPPPAVDGAGTTTTTTTNNNNALNHAMSTSSSSVASSASVSAGRLELVRGQGRPWAICQNLHSRPIVHFLNSSFPSTFVTIH